MRIVFSLLVLCTLSVLLQACNTIQGAGQDIEAGGEAISQAASDAKN